MIYMSYPRSRYEKPSDHPLKKFGILIFPLAVLGTIAAFAYGGIVGNFIGYMALGCVIVVGFYYMIRLFL